jgi:hypothetical protein
MISRTKGNVPLCEQTSYTTLSDLVNHLHMGITKEALV